MYSTNIPILLLKFIKSIYEVMVFIFKACQEQNYSQLHVPCHYQIFVNFTIIDTLFFF